jgi:very-short-patch-repair endonuclease
VVAALSDQAVRDKLTAAVRQSEAARRPFDKAWERVTGDLFDPNEEVSTHITLNKATLPELKKWAADRALDAARLDEWARFIKVEQAAEQFGIAAIMNEVKEGEIPPAEAADAFKARFIRLWLDTVHQQVPLLGAFTTEAHERLIARFSETDRLLIRATPEKLRSKLLSNPTRPIARDGAPERSEMGVLLREVNKKRRHLPLRRLFAEIPSLLPRIKPCLMMSPLAVSTYLDSPELTFDLVIFDEASQVRPHDAICAIYRGSQLVVGGDPRQLPPTDFFTRTSDDLDDGEGEAGTAPFESLLDVCLSLGLTRKPLQWHYRSRREALIAFSNHYFYGGRLVTFPSATEAASPAITFHRVPDACFRDGANPIEARKVAELVLEHARTSPNRSLGVIAFSLRQQDRILAELEVLRRQNSSLESFFSENRDEPFFVKNLENVQGDERDVILLAVGYGPDESGKVAMRFGPLNRAGGERRLNVAITRSRLAMTVVSSITSAEIDLARTSAEGAKLLKAFLDYAENGPRTLPDAAASSTSPAESPFEQAVADELVRRGLTIQRRIGFGGYIVDIAILDPERGDNYLLGVECDGQTYRSAVTARDRDRLRRAVLEGLGWRLIRVWSTDWIRDRDKQVRRILSALDDARKPTKGAVSAALEFDRVPMSRRRSSKAVEFESIESVPEAAITDAVVGSLVELGSMPVEDLVAAVGRRLGFKRTGPRIRERVTNAVNGLVVTRTAAVDNERVRLAERPKP